MQSCSYQLYATSKVEILLFFNILTTLWMRNLNNLICFVKTRNTYIHTCEGLVSQLWSSCACSRSNQCSLFGWWMSLILNLNAIFEANLVWNVGKLLKMGDNWVIITTYNSQGQENLPPLFNSQPLISLRFCVSSRSIIQCNHSMGKSRLFFSTRLLFGETLFEDWKPIVFMIIAIMLG